MGNTNTLESVTDIDFEVLRECLLTQETKALSPQREKMVRICRDCYGMMEKYPNRIHLIHALESLHGLSYRQAARYVDFTRQTWGNMLDYNPQFCQTFLMNQLMKEISNPKTDPNVRAKNLATLQKALASMPTSDIDPTLMESNQIYINFVLGDKNFQLSQKVIRSLPKAVQEELFAGVHNEITDVEAEEILDT